MKDLRLGMTKGCFKQPVERDIKRGFRHLDEKFKMVKALELVKKNTRGLKFWSAVSYLQKVNPSALENVKL